MKIDRTDAFIEWFRRLKDLQAKARIAKRLLRVEKGNFGDHGGVGEGVMELRLHFGPGYRLYYVERGAELIILLGGGIKDSQAGDIEKAKELAKTL